MPVDIDQIIRTKRKTVALIVRPDGTVIVRAPLRAPTAFIQEFVAKNNQWIEKKRAQMRAAAPPAAKQYVSGESFPYLGNFYPLVVVEGQRKGRLFEGESFNLAESELEEAELVFEKWYRKQAREILNQRVNLYARQHGFEYRRVGVTSARTRWGSCSASGSLNFSWRLVQAPLDIVDYVVIHELVHTVFHDHSKRFWKKVEQILPDYKERRNWLRKNGQRLLA